MFQILTMDVAVITNEALVYFHPCCVVNGKLVIKSPNHRQVGKQGLAMLALPFPLLLLRPPPSYLRDIVRTLNRGFGRGL